LFQGPFSTAAGFRLSFVCMGVVTLLSGVVFRYLDSAPQGAAPARAGTS
jgi:hypothetical protein